MNDIKKYPLLYTINNNNKIYEWYIYITVEDSKVYIQKEYGLQTGKKICTKNEVLSTKKNRTLYEQAVSEADKFWTDMVNNKGYKITEKIETTVDVNVNATSTPKAVETTETFKFYPMLANNFNDHKDKITYPCYIQPKIDGIRYTCYYNFAENNDIIFNSRMAKPTNLFKNISSNLKMILSEYYNLERSTLDNISIYLDGEIYSDKIPFNILNGLCNRKIAEIPASDEIHIKYNIFDVYIVNNPKMLFKDRMFILETIFNNTRQYDNIKLVKTDIVNNFNEILEHHSNYISLNYEGSMIRKNGIYKVKGRTSDLLKYKDFIDKEFEIVGATTSDTGKEKDCIIWILYNDESKKVKFTCRPQMTLEKRRELYKDYLSNPDNYIGKMYTVRYQELYENNIPRFPVGIDIRYDI